MRPANGSADFAGELAPGTKVAEMAAAGSRAAARPFAVVEDGRVLGVVDRAAVLRVLLGRGGSVRRPSPSRLRRQELAARTPRGACSGSAALAVSLAWSPPAARHGARLGDRAAARAGRWPLARHVIGTDGWLVTRRASGFVTVKELTRGLAGLLDWPLGSRPACSRTGLSWTARARPPSQLAAAPALARRGRPGGAGLGAWAGGAAARGAGRRLLPLSRAVRPVGQRHDDAGLDRWSPCRLGAAGGLLLGIAGLPLALARAG